MIFKILSLGFMDNRCYILSGNGKDAVVIDAPKGAERIKEETEKDGLTVKYVLLTHGHFDHVGAAKKLQDAGAKIYLHKSDTDKTFDARLNEPFEPDFDLSDKEELGLAGLKIKVIQTAGHTSGGVCFLAREAKEERGEEKLLLFSGDTLFCGDIGRTDLPSGNFKELEKNIKERLYTLSDDTVVYPGHGEETTIGNEKRYNNHVRG